MYVCIYNLYNILPHERDMNLFFFVVYLSLQNHYSNISREDERWSEPIFKRHP